MENEDLKAHESYMRLCIDLAKMAKQHGDSPVGALIVQNGKIIGQGIEGGKTQKDITCHAEIEAIRDASKHIEKQDLSDCILYTTHEPCIMCSYVIRHMKIPIVVTGITTGEIGGFNSHFPVLLDTTIKRWSAPPTIVKGVLENECSALQD